MRLTILSVGYPLAAVSPDSAGGSEQILSALDRALVAAGHRSIVVAMEGSTVAGELRAIPAPGGVLDDEVRQTAQMHVGSTVARTLDRENIDLVHMHGLDFYAYLPRPGVPLLATLHLPPDWYPKEALQPRRPETWLNCVSRTQHEACPLSTNLLSPIENGVPVEALTANHAKRDFALFLGRICPEKGVHVAIEAARRAGVPLIIAGQIYPYEWHQRYFAEEVQPHLGPRCRFVGPVGFARKRRLLTAARCLLVPSLVAETSSLVAREAAACGTAVIAFPNGAMVETVEDGRTGFLVTDAAGMADAISASATIDSSVCRAVATARFSDRVMADAYLDRYAQLVSRSAAGAA